MAEPGLQILPSRFDSGRGLQHGAPKAAGRLLANGTLIPGGLAAVMPPSMLARTMGLANVDFQEGQPPANVTRADSLRTGRGD